MAWLISGRFSFHIFSQSLRIVTTTLDLRHPGKPGTLGAGLLHLDGEFKSKLKEVKGKTSDLAHKFPGANIHEQVRGEW